MAEVSLLVMLALFVIGAIVLFKVAKGVIQGTLLVSAVLAIILAVAAAVVVKDALDFQHNFQAGGKLLLFSADNGTRITSGLLVKGANATGEAVKLLSGAEIEQLGAAFGRGDYAAMKGDNFKLVLLREEPILASMPEEMNFEGGNVSKEIFLMQLRSVGVEQRAQLLSALFDLQLGRNPLGIISGYRKGSIMVYPETAIFKVVRILPESLFRKVPERLLGKNLQSGAMGKAPVSAA